MIFSEATIASLNSDACVMEIPYREYRITITLLSQSAGGGTVISVFDPNGKDIVSEFVDGHFAATAANVRRSMAMVDFKIEGFRKAPIAKFGDFEMDPRKPF